MIPLNQLDAMIENVKAWTDPDFQTWIDTEGHL